MSKYTIDMSYYTGGEYALIDSLKTGKFVKKIPFESFTSGDEKEAFDLSKEYIKKHPMPSELRIIPDISFKEIGIENYEFAYESYVEHVFAKFLIEIKRAKGEKIDDVNFSRFPYYRYAKNTSDIKRTETGDFDLNYIWKNGTKFMKRAVEQTKNHIKNHPVPKDWNAYYEDGKMVYKPYTENKRDYQNKMFVSHVGLLEDIDEILSHDPELGYNKYDDYPYSCEDKEWFDEDEYNPEYWEQFCKDLEEDKKTENSRESIYVDTGESEVKEDTDEEIETDEFEELRVFKIDDDNFVDFEDVKKNGAPYAVKAYELMTDFVAKHPAPKGFGSFVDSDGGVVVPNPIRSKNLYKTFVFGNFIKYTEFLAINEAVSKEIPNKKFDKPITQTNYEKIQEKNSTWDWNDMEVAFPDIANKAKEISDKFIEENPITKNIYDKSQVKGKDRKNYKERIFRLVFGNMINRHVTGMLDKNDR